MPTKPPTHSPHGGRQAADRTYAPTRRLDPPQAAAEKIRGSTRWHKVRKLQLGRQLGVSGAMPARQGAGVRHRTGAGGGPKSGGRRAHSEPRTAQKCPHI
jgi:hypothetical protein